MMSSLRFRHRWLGGADRRPFHGARRPRRQQDVACRRRSRRVLGYLEWRPRSSEREKHVSLNGLQDPKATLNGEFSSGRRLQKLKTTTTTTDGRTLLGVQTVAARSKSLVHTLIWINKQTPSWSSVLYKNFASLRLTE
jgi:hypothetical protein